MKNTLVKFTFMVLWVTVLSYSTEVTLKNGAVYKGEIIKEDNRFFSIKIGKSTRAINKTLVLKIDGEQYSAQQRLIPPEKSNGSLSEKNTTDSVTHRNKAGVSNADSHGTGKLWHVILTNGNAFKGKKLSENKRILVLESKGSPVSIFKNMITSIDSGQASSEVLKKTVAGKKAASGIAEVSTVNESVLKTSVSARRSVDTEKLPLPVNSSSMRTADSKEKKSPRIQISTMNITKSAPESVIKERERGGAATEKMNQMPVDDATVKKSKFTVVPVHFSENENKQAPETRVTVLPGKLPAPHRRMTMVSFEETGSDTAAVKKGEIPFRQPIKPLPAETKADSSALVDDITIIPAPLPEFVRSRKNKTVSDSSGTITPEKQMVAKKNTSAVVQNNMAANSDAPVNNSAGFTKEKTSTVHKQIKSRENGVEVVPPVALVAPVTPQKRIPETTAYSAESKKKKATPQSALPMAPAARNKKKEKSLNGKNVVVLKNGTRFIGTIKKDALHSIKFASDGAIVTILKKLINEIDGKPYHYTRTTKMNAVALATASRGQTTLKKQQRSTAQRVLFRMMPVIALPYGITAEILKDSIEHGTDWRSRSRAVRMLGAMGPWGVSAIPAAAALLTDTAGQHNTAPLTIDSMEALPLLPPGLEAARSLAQLGNKGAQKLVTAYKSENPLVRRNAVFGFGNCFYDIAVQCVKKAVTDTDAEVRRSALGSLRIPDAQPLLIKACKDRSASVRAAAATLLGKTAGGREATDALVTMVRDRSRIVRTAVAGALAETGSSRAFPTVVKLCHDKDNLVRAAAVRSLMYFEDSSVIDCSLAAALDSSVEVRTAAVDAIRKFKSSKSIPHLYSLINDSNPLVKKKAVQSLKEHTDIPMLISALDSESPLVRSNVAYILWLMTAQEFGQDKAQWEKWSSARLEQTLKGTSDASLVEKQ